MKKKPQRTAMDAMPAAVILFMTIGFRKHTLFYDGVPSYTVIARSEAT